ncbi:C39 family peptidase [Tumebacillus sp. DT12]|uniref:C39 family peptidase n=1 Tax=Tumebacillus lacus TaxID=2995335 RepID=A0ABT3X740_9BACL|nr:C39 family peptidase [Tumebacillus lacus]MCX7572261.1 C39 family peptidase [Tumebacillus lacus]
MFKKIITSAVLTTALVTGAVAVPGLTQAPVAEAAFNAPLYKQTDSRWSADLMGGGGTIGAEGCVITSVAMALAHKGITISGATTTPKNFNTWLKGNGGYSGDLLVWGAVPKLSSRITFQGRYTGGTSLSASTLRSYLDAGNKAVIAQVRSGSHWVLLKSHNGGTTFYCNDPGYSSTYYTTSNFTGFAVYTIN